MVHLLLNLMFHTFQSLYLIYCDLLQENYVVQEIMIGSIYPQIFLSPFFVAVLLNHQTLFFIYGSLSYFSTVAPNHETCFDKIVHFTSPLSQLFLLFPLIYVQLDYLSTFNYSVVYKNGQSKCLKSYHLQCFLPMMFLISAAHFFLSPRVALSNFAMVSSALS